MPDETPLGRLCPLGSRGDNKLVRADWVPAPSGEPLPEVSDEKLAQVLFLEQTARCLRKKDLSALSGIA